MVLFMLFAFASCSKASNKSETIIHQDEESVKTENATNNLNSEDKQKNGDQEIVLTFELVNENYTITGCNSKNIDSLVLPSEHEGRSVVAIKLGAFKDTTITTLTIPSSIVVIEGYAFDNCTILSVVFEVTSGWQVQGSNFALTEENVANQTLIATWLSKTLKSYKWARS